MDDSNLQHLLNRLKYRKFDEATCFFCARPLSALGATSEHVIPRWAQSRFDLWDQTFVLLNKTTIKYKYLTVPCCEECNKYQLEPIERLVADATLKGPDAVRSLGNNILFLWLGKIFYGILYKELFLSSDRAVIGSPRIVDPSLIKTYEDHLFFLQEARGKVTSVDFCPGSIFVFRTQQSENVQLRWDFTDNIDTLFIGIRMGTVGVIAVLNDGGILNMHGSVYESLENHPLHPLQFRELCAAVAYQSMARIRTPKYITLEGDPHKVYQLPLAGYSLSPFYDEWDTNKFAKVMSYYLGIPYSRIRPDPNHIASYVFDEDNKPIFMPLDE